MYCARCGAYNDEQAVYCARCGVPLGDAPLPPAHPPAPAYEQPHAPPPPDAPYGQRHAPAPPAGSYGAPREGPAYGAAPAPPERVGPIGVLLFCFPIAGAVMYFVWKDQHPAKAQRACWLALGGLALGTVLQILSSLG